MRWILIGGAAVALLAGLRRWFPVRVAGDSMLPTVRTGDLLAVRPLRTDEPRLGQVVVASQAGREVVKRVVAMPGEDERTGSSYWLQGDNAARSTDSRATGPVPRAEIAGVVRACCWPLRRAAWL